MKESMPFVLTGLATLPEKTILDETALANVIGVTKRTIRRMVGRYEIPPAIRFGGKSTWMAGAILQWFEKRAAEAQKGAERRAAAYESAKSCAGL